MNCILSVLVENRFGVLARVAGLFAGRGFNISSLAVAATEDKDISNMIITVTGDDRIMEQVKKQLNKLIDVIKVIDLTESEHVERELMLVKINADKQKRGEIFLLAEVFKAEVVDVQPKTVILEIKDKSKRLDSFIEVLSPYGIKEVSRTGRIAIKV